MILYFSALSAFLSSQQRNNFLYGCETIIFLHFSYISILELSLPISILFQYLITLNKNRLHFWFALQ